MAGGVPPDNTPDPFNFGDVSNQNLGSVVYSSTLTITGITFAEVSITNGAEFSIAGGAYTTTGIILDGQTLRLRITASSSYSTTVGTTVTVGTYSDVWNVTTRAADTTPNDYAFTNVTNAALSSIIYSDTVTVSGLSPNYTITATCSEAGDSTSTSNFVAVATYPTTPTSFGTTRSATTDSAGRLNVRTRLTTGSKFSTVFANNVYVGSDAAEYWSVTTKAAPDVNGSASPVDNRLVPVNSYQTSAQFSVSGLDPNTTYYAFAGIFENDCLIDAGTTSLTGSFGSGKAFTTSASGTAVMALYARASYNSNYSRIWKIYVRPIEAGSPNGYLCSWRILTATNLTTASGASIQTVSTPGAYTYPRFISYNGMSSGATFIVLGNLHNAYGGTSITDSSAIQVSTDGATFYNIGGTSRTLTSNSSGQLQFYIRAKAAPTANGVQYAWQARWRSLYQYDGEGIDFVLERNVEGTQYVTCA